MRKLSILTLYLQKKKKKKNLMENQTQTDYLSGQNLAELFHTYLNQNNSMLGA